LPINLYNLNSGAKYIIIAGIIIILAGIVLYFFPNAFKWFGRLPGDIRVEKQNSGFYFPIVSMIILSVVATIVINVVRRFF
jgi:H+/Cl- antiporter ClcA